MIRYDDDLDDDALRPATMVAAHVDDDGNDRMCIRCKETPAESHSLFCEHCLADFRIERMADA